jgi:hypothetical protein
MILKASVMFQVIGWVLFNQIVIGFPIAYLSYLMMKWRGSPPLRELPTFHWVLAEMAIHILMEEIGFYYSHRYCFVFMCNEFVERFSLTAHTALSTSHLSKRVLTL